MSKYRKKPVIIEAIQYLGEQNADDVDEFMDGDGYLIGPDRVVIGTLEGAMYGDMGDWIIRGVKGELYPCKPDIFAATYEPVEEI